MYLNLSLIVWREKRFCVVLNVLHVLAVVFSDSLKISTILKIGLEYWYLKSFFDNNKKIDNNNKNYLSRSGTIGKLAY